MLKYATTTRKFWRMLAPLAALAATGCLPVFIFSGSDFRIESVPLIQRASFQEVHLKFRGTLTSQRAMDVAIADALGYPLNNDDTMQKVAKDFLEPATDVLARYGMPVTIDLPTANVPERRFYFSTGWTMAASPIGRDGRSLCSAVMHVTDACTFEARLSNAYAEFNPQLAKQIKIYAVLQLRIRVDKGGSSTVAPGPLQTARLQVFLEREISDDLIREYDGYFKRHGLNVAIRGF
jgi:hypothetical protein